MLSFHLIEAKPFCQVFGLYIYFNSKSIFTFMWSFFGQKNVFGMPNIIINSLVCLCYINFSILGISSNSKHPFTISFWTSLHCATPQMLISFTHLFNHNHSKDANVSILSSSSNWEHSLSLSFVHCANPWILFSFTHLYANNFFVDTHISILGNSSNSENHLFEC